MPSKSIDDLLADLEGAEKTAEEVFTEEITKDEDEQEEKVASEEEVAEEAEEAEEATEEETEEKTASEQTEEEDTEEAIEEDVEEKTASTENLSAEDLVKIAKDMGKVMAHSAYAELVAMGIMPATNDDIAVPPISQISMPMNSPVTVAADAKEQMKGEGQEKKASTEINKKEVLTNLYNTYFPEEE